MKTALFAIAALSALSFAAAGYDKDAALTNVYLSAAAYCNPGDIQGWNCTACGYVDDIVPGSVSVVYDAKYELQGYVAASTSSETIVAFRGTSNLENWIENLKSAEKVPYGGCTGCNVGDGFLDAWTRLKPQVMSALSGLGGSSKPLWVTGHSLGAAIAALAAFDLSNAGYSFSRDVYTFGEPRVGDQTFSTAHNNAFPNEWWRVVHYADIVPHLPLEAMGFTHVPTEVWYNEASSSYQVCNGSGEDPNCSDSLWLPDSVSDHLDYLNVHISDLC